jgi:hypothetical protein
MSRRNSDDPAVEEVRARFEQWRQIRQGKAAIPDELWAAAMDVARRNGVNRTAAALRLDGGKLKRLMVAAGGVPEKVAPPAFVELISPRPQSLPECTIELEGRGGKLRIQLKSASASDLAALSRALWEAAS